MVDDLTDGWIDAEGTGRPLGGNDWGAGCDAPGSAFAWLRDELMARFPELKVSFFVPVDRAVDVDPPHFPSRFEAIDRRPAFREFLQRLDADPRCELAYHGKEHGRGGARHADYVPEFAGYRSVDEAVEGLERGKAIWRAVLGRDPEGGKFPAYEPGAVGDAAVERAGFLWWCRRWDRGAAAGETPGSFPPRFFGERGVVDLPSTLHGGLLTRPPLRSFRPRRLAGAGLQIWRSRSLLQRQLAALLEGGDVVSVQEHITWSRPDRDRQTPNVFDDVPTLSRIYGALRGRPVWHATCGEIARYFEARERSTLRPAPGGFELRYGGRQAEPVALSLVVRGRFGDAVRLRGPGGELMAPVARRLADGAVATEALPLRSGSYALLEAAAAS
jgi:hypothetical protein